MTFKCQKWFLTFIKFHKTLLSFKMPKCGILNAKKEAFKMRIFQHFNCQKRLLSFMKWTPGPDLFLPDRVAHV